MTYDRPRPTHDALAASLRTWALAFVVWLAEALGTHALTRSMRGWVHVQITQAERGAAALVAFAAMRLAPAPFAPTRRGGARPLAGPRGFARVCIHTRDMRAVFRFLFPCERDLLRRAARLAQVLRTFAANARRVARRIARILPATRLRAIAPPSTACTPCADADAPLAPDSS